MASLGSGCVEDELEGGAGWEEVKEEEATDRLASEVERALSIEEAVKALLQGLGEDHEREGLRRTPHRVAEAFRGGTRGYKQKVKDIVQGALFPEAGLNPGVGYAGGVGGLVVVRDINLFSYCESCLLPFSIKCHVGYVPSGGHVVGLSKLSRVADVFARRFQDPKRLAREICAALHNSINPAGVAVSLQCCHMKFNHLCDTNFTHSTISDMRNWGTVLVSSRSGVFKEEKNSLWDDFKSLLKLSGAVIKGGDTHHSHVTSWCPARSLEVPVSSGHCARNSKNGKTSSTTVVSQASMVAAVASILHSLGEDTLRKELLGTPDRYVQWLLNFKSSNWGLDLNSLDICKVNSCVVKDGNTDSKNEMQTELGIPFFSLCEHHLLPFHGVVHIGYLIKQEGIYIEQSALQQMVQFFACKLQVQERLTRQIAEAVYSSLNVGVMVVVEAHHNCMISRGIEKVGSNTATIAALGQFSSDSNTKALFLQTIASNATSGI
ncbi:GTP cyclohydrolase 1-like [Curcuma longa]|uniref:GTP cyclohydrolase 1-like n=1 Tax=Curcuma longa TaxID=136217 RepID=UPI003D9F3768